MKEDFLHYLWKFKFFAIKELRTTQNIPLEIIKTGQHNFNSGPDFFNSKLKIGNEVWAGNVEIHVKSSDWYVHGHESDTNYDNVILHVVWIYDLEIFGSGNRVIPTLELNKIVSRCLIRKYQKLFSKSVHWINCENDIHTIDNFTLNNWLESLYFERLEQKSIVIQQLLKKCTNDWEATLFKLLTKNFGLKVNGESFSNLANSLDFKIVRKERDNLNKLEALFFGQAGFLFEEIEEGYYIILQKEYKYLQLKHDLKPLNKGQFQFFRLRPSNFPTIRLAQLSKLYFSKNSLFATILKAENKDDFYKIFDIEPSEFWQDHYNFSSVSSKRTNKLTKSFIDLILINTIIPLKFTYYREMGDLDAVYFLNLIHQIQPEKNNIIKKYKSLLQGKKGTSIIRSSLHSQSFLQLKNEYCNLNRCLSCAIGNSLLKN